MSSSSTAESSKLLAYLQLFRAPNVFTAVADVLMGYLVVRRQVDSPGLLLGLVAASLLLYIAGMVLNDVFDAEVDAAERPERPIPSGRIDRGWARVLGYQMLCSGAAFGWLVSYFTNDLRAGLVATALAVCVWVYDGVLKRTPLGPVAMGGCRFLNVLLGMSAANGAWAPAHWVIAGGLGVYIAGVTWFARGEAHDSQPVKLSLSLVVMLVGIGLLYSFPYWAQKEFLPELKVPVDRWEFFWGVLALLIGWRCVRAILEPSPAMVQAAVKNSILSLFILDAAVCFSLLGYAGPGVPWAIVILLLLLPAMFLGRWVYST
jgi:4-hydroxybenzoate polyprenyltransferase